MTKHAREQQTELSAAAATRMQELEQAGELSRPEPLVEPLRTFRSRRGRPSEEIISADRGTSSRR